MPARGELAVAIVISLVAGSGEQRWLVFGER